MSEDIGKATQEHPSFEYTSESDVRLSIPGEQDLPPKHTSTDPFSSSYHEKQQVYSTASTAPLLKTTAFSPRQHSVQRLVRPDFRQRIDTHSVKQRTSSAPTQSKTMKKRASRRYNIWRQIANKRVRDRDQIADIIYHSRSGLDRTWRSSIWIRVSGANKIFRKSLEFHRLQQQNGQIEFSSNASTLTEAQIYRYYVVKALECPNVETCKGGTIELDLSGPGELRWFKSMNDAKRDSLHRILCGVSAFYDTFMNGRRIYCLQVAKVAAWILKNVPSEDMCFWTLLALLMRDRFHLASTLTHAGIHRGQSSRFTYSQTPQKHIQYMPTQTALGKAHFDTKLTTLEHTLSVHFPKLNELITRTKFDFRGLCTRLITGLFIDVGLPRSTVTKIWDLFVVGGWNILFGVIASFLHFVSQSLDGILNNHSRSISAKDVESCFDKCLEVLQGGDYKDTLFYFLERRHGLRTLGNDCEALMSTAFQSPSAVLSMTPKVANGNKCQMSDISPQSQSSRAAVMPVLHKFPALPTNVPEDQSQLPTPLTLSRRDGTTVQHRQSFTNLMQSQTFTDQVMPDDSLNDEWDKLEADIAHQMVKSTSLRSKRAKKNVNDDANTTTKAHSRLEVNGIDHKGDGLQKLHNNKNKANAINYHIGLQQPSSVPLTLQESKKISKMQTHSTSTTTFNDATFIAGTETRDAAANLV